MSNTARCFLVAALVLGAALFARHEMNTADEDFDFALTSDWSSSGHADRWQAVVIEDDEAGATMDDVFHAALAPRSRRTAEVIR